MIKPAMCGWLEGRLAHLTPLEELGFAQDKGI